MITDQANNGDTRGYRPIRDYAMIGDGHGAALIARDGAIDWCCLGRFDAEPVFCRLLDAGNGGFLAVEPAGDFSVTRGYLDDTNILQTCFSDGARTVTLTDFMPVGRRPGSGPHNYVDLIAPNTLYRIVTVTGGAVRLRLRYRPSLAFARETARLRTEDGRVICTAGPILHCSHRATTFIINDDLAEADIDLPAGDRLVLALCRPDYKYGDPLARAAAFQDITAAFWREWIGYCRYRGPYESAVRRSLLAIKLLIYAPSGAVAAAATTSLPEEIGGERNWDYRFCWLRDSAFTLYALAVAGYGGEARRFSMYLPRVCSATAPELRIMYGLDGELELPEQTLDHLDGYRGSRPVRVGNGAYRQRQIDVYGEIMDWALLYQTLGGSFDTDMRRIIAMLADVVADTWHEPDHGIWEMRGPNLHHVHGKIMSWVALDRAIRLVEPRARWVTERDRIAAEVNARGLDPTAAHLVQAYDSVHTDAALLLTPLTDFPISEDVLRTTVEAVERELREGDFVYRYRNEDGLDGGEGAFLICSFWLVDALIYLGRVTEAQDLLMRLIAHENDVGLFSEEIEIKDNTFLGNFPQAYTHLALVGSAIHLELYRKCGMAGIKGTHADRARRVVSATLGWRALWAAFKATWRVGRIVSSRRSIMPAQAD